MVDGIFVVVSGLVVSGDVALPLESELVLDLLETLDAGLSDLFE
jgi:hypothetical protein